MARRSRREAPRRRGGALLVVDMLNGFLDPTGAMYCGDAARGIIPVIRRRIRAHTRRGEPVVFTCDAHAPDDPEFERFAPHSVRGTWEGRILPELPVPDPALVLTKSTLNPFYRTRLDAVLRRLAPETVEVVGVCTNICILYAVAELSVRGYRIVVPRRGVATFDTKAHGFALEQMQSVFGAKVT